MEVTSKLPQLAKAGDPESIRDAVMEVKYDGHRILAQVDGHGNVRLYARTGADKTGHTPNIESALSNLPPNTILDGEIVQLNSGEGDDWSSVQSILGSSSKVTDALTYIVFDVIEFDGRDTRALPMEQRRAFLTNLFRLPLAPAVRLADQVPYDAEGVDAIIAKGWEGVIVKDPRAPYASGKRGHGWIKVKSTATEDVVVIGATEGKGAFAGQIGALIFGQYERAQAELEDADDAYLIECGQCSGMDFAERALFTRMRDAGTLEGTVIEVQHMGKLPSGGWRHPQFKRVRTDKEGAECLVS